MMQARARALPAIFAWPRAEGGVIFRLAFRQTRRSALIWGAVFGLFAFSSVAAYITGFPTHAQRVQLASTLQSFAILLGPPRNADTVAGFTAWRVLLVASAMGAIWAMLVSTSRLRGEEDDGRWELVLAAPLTRVGATVQVLIGLAAAWLVLYGTCALLILLAGNYRGAHFPTGGSLLLALGMSSGAAMFLAIGALASQLSATRGQAVRLCAGLLGVAYLVRMIADSRTSLGWLRWLSPLGWVEELHPLRNPQLVAIVPMLGLIAVCGLATVWLAQRRDLGASILREGAVRRHETSWIGGPVALAERVTRGAAIGWLLGIGAMAFTTGLVAKSASSILSASPTIQAALGRLGVGKATQGYLGVSFLLIAVVLTLLAASQIGAIRDEEASGRLDNLLVRPVSRPEWLLGRLMVSLLVVLGVGLATGLVTWFGTSSQHIGVSLSTLLAAGLNASAPGVFVLGAGALVFAVRPALAAPLAYVIVAWSFLVNLLGSFLKGLDWLRQTSLLTHIALAPSVSPDWKSVIVLVLLGCAMAWLALVLFERRDVAYA